MTRRKRPVEDGAGIVTAFNDGQVTLRANRRTQGFHESLNNDGYLGVRAGDLIIHGLDLVHGSVGVSDSDGQVSAVCWVVSPVADMDARFIAYAMRAVARAGYVRANAKGVRSAGADYRRWETLAELPLPCPPLDYQREVATFLDRELARIGELATELRLFYRALCEQEHGIVSRKVEGLPVIPLRYRLLHIAQGWSPDCETRSAEPGEWAVLKTGCVNHGGFRPLEHKRLPEPLIPRPETEVRVGDLLMSRANTRDLVGSAALVDDTADRRLMLSDKLYRLDVMPSLLPSFLVEVLRSREVRGQIEIATSGASSSMQNISQELVRSLLIPDVTIEKQRRIVEEIADRRSGLRSMESDVSVMRERLAEYREALITEAVTGRLNTLKPAEAQLKKSHDSTGAAHASDAFAT